MDKKLCVLLFILLVYVSTSEGWFRRIGRSIRRGFRRVVRRVVRVVRRPIRVVRRIVRKRIIRRIIRKPIRLIRRVVRKRIIRRIIRKVPFVKKFVRRIPFVGGLVRKFGGMKNKLLQTGLSLLGGGRGGQMGGGGSMYGGGYPSGGYMGPGNTGVPPSKSFGFSTGKRTIKISIWFYDEILDSMRAIREEDEKIYEAFAEEIQSELAKEVGDEEAKDIRSELDTLTSDDMDVVPITSFDLGSDKFDLQEGKGDLLFEPELDQPNPQQIESN